MVSAVELSARQVGLGDVFGEAAGVGIETDRDNAVLVDALCESVEESHWRCSGGGYSKIARWISNTMIQTMWRALASMPNEVRLRASVARGMSERTA